jgi:hypothetical protein
MKSDYYCSNKLRFSILIVFRQVLIYSGVPFEYSSSDTEYYLNIILLGFIPAYHSSIAAQVLSYWILSYEVPTVVSRPVWLLHWFGRLPCSPRRVCYTVVPKMYILYGLFFLSAGGLSLLVGRRVLARFLLPSLCFSRRLLLAQSWIGRCLSSGLGGVPTLS